MSHHGNPDYEPPERSIAYRWRRRFAFFPRTIGERRIWWQRYAWRRLASHATDDLDAELPIRFSTVYVWWEEWVLTDGYVAWRRYQQDLGSTERLATTSWHRPTPTLRVVGETS